MHTMPRGRRRIVGIRGHCRWIGHLARGDSHIGWPENEIGVTLMRLQDPSLLGAAMGDVRVNVTETAPSAATVYLSGDIDHRATDQLRKALVDVIVRVKPSHLVINLDGVTAIDDQAIGALRAAESVIGDAGLTASFHTTGSRIADDLADDGIHQAA